MEQTHELQIVVKGGEHLEFLTNEESYKSYLQISEEEPGLLRLVRARKVQPGGGFEELFVA